MKNNIKEQDIEKENQRLRDALDFAVSVIEAYQMDIRNSEWTGVNLEKKGFCQGRIYKWAVKRVYAMADIRKTENI